MSKTYKLLFWKTGIIPFILFPFFSTAEDANSDSDPVRFEASYIGDNINNLSGGLSKGASYLGMANFRVGFDFQNAKLWQGGYVFVNAANTHGATPSADIIGDAQIISNIEAGNHTYIQEVWYRQSIGKLAVTAGLQDLNVEFAHSEQAGILLNSSFGILPIISGNFAAPIFPLTTPGITFEWNMTPTIKWINAVYDGSPTNFDYNPYNINWQFNSGDGILAISEVQKETRLSGLKGVYKMGFYSHFHRKSKNSASVPDSLINRLFGIYAYADQNLWERNHRRLGVFSQLGYCPSEDGICKFYAGSGLSFAGLTNKANRDILCLAFAHAVYPQENASETSIEVTWQYLITENIFIQPDCQYIVNPAGTGELLQNAFACNLRFGLNF